MKLWYYIGTVTTWVGIDIKDNEQTHIKENNIRFCNIVYFFYPKSHRFNGGVVSTPIGYIAILTLQA